MSVAVRPSGRAARRTFAVNVAAGPVTTAAVIAA